MGRLRCGCQVDRIANEVLCAAEHQSHHDERGRLLTIEVARKIWEKEAQEAQDSLPLSCASCGSVPLPEETMRVRKTTDLFLSSSDCMATPCACLKARGAPEHAKARFLDFSAVCGENSAATARRKACN